MEEQPTKMRGEAVLFKKGEKIPGNARALTDAQVLNIQSERLNKFQPQKEVRAFVYSHYLISATTGLSGLAIASMMRRNFRLGGLRRMLTYIPTIGLSGLCAGAVHDVVIKRPILLGKEGCPTCTAVTGGCLQLASGIVYPYILSLLTCVPTARDYYTLPFPAGNSKNGYFQLLRQVTPKSSWMLGLALLNIYVGSYVAARQMQIFATHLSQPPSKMKEFLKENSELLE